MQLVVKSKRKRNEKRKINAKRFKKLFVAFDSSIKLTNKIDSLINDFNN